MREEISIEMSFLLYCVRSFIEPCCGERLTAFPVERLDWECLIAFAQRHRLIPVIYSVLRKYKVKCPDVTWIKLRNARAKSIRRSLLQLAKLKIILEVFNARKIEVVVLKGMVLAQEIYGDMVNRVSSDIDLLVEPSDAYVAFSCLFELGFKTKIKKEELFHSHFMEKMRLFLGKDMIFCCPITGVLVELHWRAVESYSSFSLTANDFFRNKKKIVVAGVNIPVASWEDHLLYLCYHGARHRWDRLFWLCDIALLVTRKELDWLRVKKEIERLGIQPILRMTTELTRDLLKVTVPNDLVESSRPIGAEAKLARKVQSRILQYRPRSELPPAIVQGYQSLLWNFQLEPRFSNRVFMLLVLLFPNDRDIEFVKIPACVSVLYFFVHPVRLLYRVIVAIWKKSLRVLCVIRK